MNKVLQILVFGVFIMIGGISATAQVRMIPLTVTIVSPVNNSDLDYNTNFYFTINIANNSTTDNLVLGDTMFFNFTGEPDLLDPESFYSFALPAGIPAGGNTTLTILQGPNDNTTGSNIEKEYCIILVGTADAGIPGGTWSNSNPNAVDGVCTSFTLLPEVVSVGESNLSYDWNVYPNPANNQFSINADRLSQDAHVVVHNSVGQRVFELKSGAYRNSGIINSQEWQSGIYMVTITQNGSSHTERIVVQH